MTPGVGLGVGWGVGAAVGWAVGCAVGGGVGAEVGGRLCGAEGSSFRAAIESPVGAGFDRASLQAARMTIDASTIKAAER